MIFYSSSYAAAILVHEEEEQQSDIEQSKKVMMHKNNNEASIHSGDDDEMARSMSNSSLTQLKHLTLGEKMKRLEIDCPDTEACLPVPPFSPGLPGLVSPLPPNPLTTNKR